MKDHGHADFSTSLDHDIRQGRANQLRQRMRGLPVIEGAPAVCPIQGRWRDQAVAMSVGITAPVQVMENIESQTPGWLPGWSPPFLDPNTGHLDHLDAFQLHSPEHPVHGLRTENMQPLRDLCMQREHKLCRRAKLRSCTSKLLSFPITPSQECRKQFRRWA